MDDEIRVVPRTSERVWWLLGGLVFVLGAAALAADGGPFDAVPVLAAMGLVLGALGTRHVRALSRIRIGRERITGLRSLRHGAYTIDLARASVEALHGGTLIVVRDGSRVWKLRNEHARNWNEIVGALRARVRPAGWLASGPAPCETSRTPSERRGSRA